MDRDKQEKRTCIEAYNYKNTSYLFLPQFIRTLVWWVDNHGVFLDSSVDFLPHLQYGLRLLVLWVVVAGERVSMVV